MYREYLEDRKYSLLLFVYIWVMYAVVSMTKNCYSAAMASIVNEGIMTKSQTGLIMAAFYLVYAPLQIIGGVFADRKNPEKLIITGLVGAGVANLIIFFNQNYYVMMATWIFNGIIQFGIWPSVFKIISSQLKVSHRKNAAFLISFSTSGGLILAYTVAMFVTEWQYNFLISAVLLFIFAAVLYLLYRHLSKKMVREDIGRISEQAVKEIKKANQQMAGKEIGGMNVFFKSGFLFFIPVFVTSYLSGNAMKTLSPTMLMESYDSITPAFGNFLNLFIILASMGGIVIVKFCLYPKIIREEIKGIGLMLLGLLPFIGSILLLGRVPVFFMVISMAMVALLTEASGLLQNYIVMRFAKIGKSGEAAGIANAGNALGVVLQSYGIAYLADCWGWKAVALFLLILIAVACMIVVLVTPRWLKFTKEYEM